MNIPPHARSLHESALVVDLHADTAERLLDEGIDWSRRLPDGHLDLPRMREGGLDAQFFACWVDPAKTAPDRSLRRALDLAEGLKRAVARRPDDVGLALGAGDVRRLAREGKRAAVLCVEGGHAIEDGLDGLRALHAAGARYMTLTWNNHTNWADACRGTPRHRGLTDFGRVVIREMNRLGMMVDVSHASEETFRQALETSSDPVIASHSNARALCDHPRNLTDAQLAAVGKQGGVVGVNFYAAFLSTDYGKAADAAWDAMDEAEKAWPAGVRSDPARRRAAQQRFWDERLAGVPRPGLADVVRHIDHIARVAGIDAVALGSDFDGIPAPPEGLEDSSRLPALTAALLAHGFGEAEARKILGENVLRVMEQVVG